MSQEALAYENRHRGLYERIYPCDDKAWSKLRDVIHLCFALLGFSLCCMPILCICCWSVIYHCKIFPSPPFPPLPPPSPAPTLWIIWIHRFPLRSVQDILMTSLTKASKLRGVASRSLHQQRGGTKSPSVWEEGGGDRPPYVFAVCFILENGRRNTCVYSYQILIIIIIIFSSVREHHVEWSELLR